MSALNPPAMPSQSPEAVPPPALSSAKPETKPVQEVPKSREREDVSSLHDARMPPEVQQPEEEKTPVEHDATEDIQDDAEEEQFSGVKRIPERRFLKVFIPYCRCAIGIVIILALVLFLGGSDDIPREILAFGWAFWLFVLGFCLKFWMDARYAGSVLATLEYNASLLKRVHAKCNQKNEALDSIGFFAKFLGTIIGVVTLIGIILSLLQGGWGFTLAFLGVGGSLFMGYWGRGSICCAQAWNEEVANLLQQTCDPAARASSELDHVLGVGTMAGETKTIDLPGGETMEMVWCPAGSFTMGAPFGEGVISFETPHSVKLTSGYWLGKTPVTQRQWKSVMGNNPSYYQGDDLPVESVNWMQCQEFCRKTGLALPTEAQWEYACRAGSTGAYAGTGNLETMGWFERNSGGETKPVGQKNPNAWGLYDMHGNVLEWCADWYGKYSGNSVSDPTGASWGFSRVLRGGNWGSYARKCRSASRDQGSPSYAYNRHEFRVCWTITHS